MIFISYRRADSESVVGRIYSELKKHFPTQDVFLDHDSIPLGKPFLDVIRERLATSMFAIVLIGPQWCSVKDEKTGQRRLDDPNDFVRLEVETALATSGVNVIPLWVMRATTTPEEIATLPTSLQPLFRNNGLHVRPVPDENHDILRLIGKLTLQLNSESATDSKVFGGQQFHPRGNTSNGRTKTSHSHLQGDANQIKRNARFRPPIEPLFRTESDPIIGVDFGTSNSFAAVSVNGEIKLVPNRFGYLSSPTAVYIQPDGRLITGDPAVSMTLRDPTHGMLHVKRLFGTTGELEAYGRKYSSPQLASVVLNALRMDCERFLGASCRHVVITIPAYYCEAQLDDVREACTLAGLEIVRFVAEPTAACLAARKYFNFDDAQEFDDSTHRVAVFDLGGGTFDISILEVGVTGDCDRVFEILAVDGDCFLGGIDYDQAIIEYCFDQFYAKTGISLFGDITAAMRLRDAAERAKIELSSSELATVFVPYIFADATGSFDLNVPISRSGFDALTEQLTSKIMECSRNALTASNLSTVDCLLMVGLATRTPNIREKAEALFGIKAATFVDPDTAVAVGAGIQASVLQGAERKILLLDAISHDVAIETFGGVSSLLVKRYSTVPLRKIFHYVTANCEQNSALISIWQGNFSVAKKNILLSRFIFDQVTPAANAKSSICVQIDVETTHSIVVHVTDKFTGSYRRVDVSNEPVFEAPCFSDWDSLAIDEAGDVHCAEDT